MVITTATPWTLTDLQDLLEQQEWQAADHVTLALMLAACDRTTAGCLDGAAIARLPCPTLHQIDQLWASASQHRFGFSAQLQIYAESGHSAFQFSQRVGWLWCSLRPLGFCKFYDFLHFREDAPAGHLPAYWYWKLGWDRSLWRGGFGTGRGGGFGDPDMLDAMMLRLERCSLV